MADSDPRTTTQQRGVAVTLRRPDFEYDEDVPRVWHSGGAAVTAFWNALSIGTPLLEAEFIKDGARLEGRLQTPEQVRELRSFIRQEGTHAKLHRRYNDLLVSWGYPVERCEKPVRTALRLLSRTNTTFRCAVALSGEHFIGEIGDIILMRPEVMETVGDRRVTQLWLWHAYEEVEHKAALFDAFTAVHGRGMRAYAYRVTGLFGAIGILLSILPRMVAELLRHDGKSRDPREWIRLGRYLFGTSGVLRNRSRAVFEFLRPTFHPWTYLDNATLLADRREDLIDPTWEVHEDRSPLKDADLD
jgi:predicted metal-dependent hydrolase